MCVMTRNKKVLIFFVSLIMYFIILPELIFNQLSDDNYHLLAAMTNPFNSFGSTVNSFIIAIIIIPVILAVLTVFIVNKVVQKR